MSLQKFREKWIQKIPIRRLRKQLAYKYGWFPGNFVQPDVKISSIRKLKLGGNVYIGGGETDAMRYIADVIKEIRGLHPNITFHLYSGNAEDVMEKLDKKLLDFGLLVQHNDTAKYDSVTLPVADVWGILMRKDCPLAQYESVRLENLKGLPLINSRQAIKK